MQGWFDATALTSSRTRLILPVLKPNALEYMFTTDFAKLAEPPYHAVIFSSQRTEGDDGYGPMADRMIELARTQPMVHALRGPRGACAYGMPCL